MTTDRRAEYQRRMREALRAGGRAPSAEEWTRILGEAREVALRRHRQMTQALTTEPTPHDHEPWVRLPPGHVAIRAETLLGLEVEIGDMGATREACEQDRLELRALISRAKVEPGCGEVDLFKLERALETGVGLPRDASAQMLEVVRELIRWRAVAKEPG